ncbi:centrosomal protein of 70 kDa isoform 2-T2 [Odontesthes bonariensis]|uniref:centrosomal protein of 70 kDa isoform X2 n=1 Tax=Odontesthes bonariensis TaxID=219752 RepID=UPI003F5830FB
MDARHSREKTYVYLWTGRQFQVDPEPQVCAAAVLCVNTDGGCVLQEERVEWDHVNKVLQRRGFRPVSFADPVENKNLSDLVLLDKKSAGEVRSTLRTMLTDSERRQALIQELVKSNNQLKEEVQKHVSRAAQQSQRVTELEGLLEQVKTRVQDLEERYLGKAAQQHSYSQQLQQEKTESQRRCQMLEEKLSEQQEEAAQLQRKLYFTVKEEERRLAQQSRTFQNICKKVCLQSSAADQQVLDVIDFYETRITDQLRADPRTDPRAARGEAEASKEWEKTATTITPSFKTILKTYQDQLKRSSRQEEELKREVDRLKQELDARPTLREVKFYKHKLRRLEGSNRHSNTRSPAVDENMGARPRGAGMCLHYHQLLTQISAVVSDPSAPLRPSADGVEPANFQALLPALGEWARQLHLLKELQRSVSKLSVRLMPWRPGGGDPAEGVKVEAMLLQVEAMLESVAAEEEQELRSPTRYTLASMVSHFQKLFDVRSLSGVYPRMSEVYTRLAEMTNAMRNLRDVLDLDGRVPPAQVVQQVARVLSSRVLSSSEHAAGLQALLGDADIHSIITKVKQHDEFFPAFHALITDVLHTLGVSRLDDLLPALKSLKQTQRQAA